MLHLPTSITLLFACFVLTNLLAVSPYIGEQAPPRPTNPEGPYKIFTRLGERLGDEAKCPRKIFESHEDYIRYTYRLLTLSFLYEALEDHRSLTEYGDLLIQKKTSSCRVDWNQLLKNCHPETTHMKKFCQRSQNYLSSTAQKTHNGRPLRNEEFLSLWKEHQLQKEAKGISWGLLFLYLDNFDTDNIWSQLENICKREQELFLAICSENDHIWGLSKIEVAKKVLLKANTMSIIDQEGKGEACLNRFVESYAGREMEIDYLSTLFYEVMAKMEKKSELHSLQGKLYLPGAMEEFEQKGLTDLLFDKVSLPTPTPTITPIPTTKPPSTKTTVKNKLILLPTPTPSPVTIQPTFSSTPEPTLSLFEKALQRTKRYKQITILNLKEWIEENPFDEELLRRFDKLLKEYQTEATLKRLKNHDQLGDKNHPLGLTFIKFLLQTNKEQGLKNISKVLGERFYVVNDLEGKKESIIIRFYPKKGDKIPWRIELTPDNEK